MPIKIACPYHVMVSGCKYFVVIVSYERIKCILVSRVSAVVINIKNGCYPSVVFNLDGCNVTCAWHIQHYPFAGVNVSVAHMTDQIVSWLINLFEGKTDLKFGGVLILLNEVVWDSCKRII